MYVNRNLIGAVVGAQPFGGHVLSGTGPKAGGPLYLRRLLARCPTLSPLPTGKAPEVARAWRDRLIADGHTEAAEHCTRCMECTPLGVTLELPGPVGERNVYRLEPRGTILCVAPDEASLRCQISAALVTGNRALPGPASDARVDAVLFDGDEAGLRAINQEMAHRDGPIVPVYLCGDDPPLEWLVRERAISTNTAAAGGNATLMSIG